MRTTYQKAFDHAMNLVREGKTTNEVLDYLTHAAEEAASTDDTVSSILLLDTQGLLRNGASPQLPQDYLSAIDGLKPDPAVGTCAAAAATGEMVITEDFFEDQKWAELRHLPLSLGFKGAWSMPIISDSGKVLGTFGTYFSQKRQPTQVEINGVALLARAAAIAIHQGETSRKPLNA